MSCRSKSVTHGAWLVLCGLLGAAHAASAQAGEQAHQRVCVSCHGPGPIKAPKFGDRNAWRPLLKEGQVTLTAVAWLGIRAMCRHAAAIPICRWRNFPAPSPTWLGPAGATGATRAPMRRSWGASAPRSTSGKKEGNAPQRADWQP